MQINLRPHYVVQTQFSMHLSNSHEDSVPIATLKSLVSPRCMNCSRAPQFSCHQEVKVPSPTEAVNPPGNLPCASIKTKERRFWPHQYATYFSFKFSKTTDMSKNTEADVELWCGDMVAHSELSSDVRWECFRFMQYSIASNNASL
jgi:hypothetical protein